MMVMRMAGRMWKRLRMDQRGVAMVTVLFVGAAMTAMISVASVVAIREFRAGTDDRKSLEAVAYADAGIDRFLDYLKSGQVDYSKLYKSGCENPALTLPKTSVGTTGGTFTATLRVFNRNATSPATRFGASACAARPISVNKLTPLFVAITSEGTHPAARREVMQVLKILPFGLPIGHYANFVSVSGNPTMTNVSIFSETQIYGRDKLALTGTDPYYTLQDFWPGGPWGTGRLGTDFAPAAAHAAQGLFVGSGGGTKPEFPGPTAPTTRNCAANDTRNGGIATRSLWDSDGSAGSGAINTGCTGETGFPPTSKFTSADLDRLAPRKLGPQEHQALKDAAKEFGLYCNFTNASQNNAANYCQKLGGAKFTPPSVWQSGDIQSMFDAGVSTFVAYFDFEVGTELDNFIKWQAGNSWPCSTDPAVNRNVTLIVKNGGYEMQSGAKLNGAIIVDGNFKYSGGPSVNGTIIAKAIEMSGGANFSIDPCWLATLSGVFTFAEPVHWTEIDR
jgi:hypothetical protein